MLFDIKMSIFGAKLVFVTGGYEVRSRGHVTISQFVPSGTLAFNEVPMGIGMVEHWHLKGTPAFEEISLALGWPGDWHLKRFHWGLVRSLRFH